MHFTDHRGRRVGSSNDVALSNNAQIAESSNRATLGYDPATDLDDEFTARYNEVWESGHGDGVGLANPADNDSFVTEYLAENPALAKSAPSNQGFGSANPQVDDTQRGQVDKQGLAIGVADENGNAMHHDSLFTDAGGFEQRGRAEVNRSVRDHVDPERGIVQR